MNCLEFSKAEEVLRKITEINPSNSVAWINLAICLLRQHRGKEALEVISKTLDRFKGNVSVWLKCLSLVDEYPQLNVVDFYRKACELNVRESELWMKLGHLLRTYGKFEEAQEAYSRALELKPSLEAYLELGFTLFLKRDYSKAEEMFKQAAEKYSQSPKAWEFLGEIFFHQAKFSEAEKVFRKVLELDKQYCPAWVNLIKSIMFLGRFNEAEKTAREALKYCPKSPPILKEYGRLMLEKGAFSEASHILTEAAKLSEEDYDVWYLLALSFKGEGSLEEAEKACRKATRIRPDSWKAWYLLGEILYEKSNYKESVKALSKALSLNPQSEEVKTKLEIAKGLAKSS